MGTFLICFPLNLFYILVTRNTFGMHTISTILLSSVLVLGLVGINAVNAQTFDVQTETGEGEAVITVRLATNNTVVIPPNGTIIEVPGNVTQVDNDTVVITPENETVTELPGNVTVITPPEPEPCGCPPVENVTDAGAIDPVIVQPAPGQEVITENGTQLITNETQTEPIIVPEPPIEDNQTGPTLPVEPQPGNETSTGNDSALAPASYQQDIPWWQA